MISPFFRVIFYLIRMPFVGTVFKERPNRHRSDTLNQINVFYGKYFRNLQNTQSQKEWKNDRTFTSFRNFSHVTSILLTRTCNSPNQKKHTHNRFTQAGRKRTNERSQKNKSPKENGYSNNNEIYLTLLTKRFPWQMPIVNTQMCLEDENGDKALDIITLYKKISHLIVNGLVLWGNDARWST